MDRVLSMADGGLVTLDTGVAGNVMLGGGGAGATGVMTLTVSCLVVSNLESNLGRGGRALDIIGVLANSRSGVLCGLLLCVCMYMSMGPRTPNGDTTT